MGVTRISWEGVDSIYLAEDRDKWQALMSVVMNIVSMKCREFLEQPRS
jgi:hypothetical protein